MSAMMLAAPTTEAPKPVSRPLQGVHRQLTEDYSYEWSAEDSTYRLNVPKGFVWDQASVPRLFWTFIAPHDLSEASALIHDLIYRHAGRLPIGSFQFLTDVGWLEMGHVWKRSEADQLFRYMMHHAPVKEWRKRAGYRVVRLLGFRSFKMAADPMDKDGILERD